MRRLTFVAYPLFLPAERVRRFSDISEVKKKDQTLTTISSSPCGTHRLYYHAVTSTITERTDQAWPFGAVSQCPNCDVRINTVFEFNFYQRPTHYLATHHIYPPTIQQQQQLSAREFRSFTTHPQGINNRSTMNKPLLYTSIL